MIAVIIMVIIIVDYFKFEFSFKVNVQIAQSPPKYFTSYKMIEAPILFQTAIKNTYSILK